MLHEKVGTSGHTASLVHDELPFGDHWCARHRGLSMHEAVLYLTDVMSPGVIQPSPGIVLTVLKSNVSGPVRRPAFEMVPR